MAYPTVSAPYGLKPVNSIDGKPYAGAFRQIPVAAGFATAIFDGDTVVIDSTGYLVKSTTTNSGDIVGVCVGGQYVNSNGQTVQGQYYPASQSTTTNLSFGYVVDDPNAVFKVVATNGAGTTTPTAYSRAIVGSNVAITVNTGSTATGDSYYGIDGASAATTNTLPVRVVDVVPERNRRAIRHESAGRPRAGPTRSPLFSQCPVQCLLVERQIGRGEESEIDRQIRVRVEITVRRRLGHRLAGRHRSGAGRRSSSGQVRRKPAARRLRRTPATSAIRGREW